MDNALDKYRKNHFLGSGWSFPVRFSLGNYQLETSEYEQNINESIQTILLTPNGSRPMEPQFGSGLHQFFFRSMNETLKGEMIDSIKYALLNNEPRITIEKIDVTFPDQKTGAVDIGVKYVINQTNTRHNYVFPFYLNEGTNL